MLSISEKKEGEHIINLDDIPTPPTNSFWKTEDQLPGRIRGEVKLERRGDLYLNNRKIGFFLADAQKGGRIVGRQLKEVLKNQPVLGSNVLDYLLAHQELIPGSWKSEFIFFWGDIFRDSDDNLYVCYLHRCRDGWCRSCSWLGDDWFGFNPAACLAPE